MDMKKKKDIKNAVNVICLDADSNKCREFFLRLALEYVSAVLPAPTFKVLAG